MPSLVKLTECPRDAMQGLHDFIPTDIKAAYINLLLHVGFDTIDFGSFVSPKAVPQMQDTTEVLDRLDLSATRSKLQGGQRGRTARADQFPGLSFLDI
jgi:hydroxymethylglutaryl-CoA lyase